MTHHLQGIRPGPRRFGLLDAMLLVAATAVGLAADRGLRDPGNRIELAEIVALTHGEWTAKNVLDTLAEVCLEAGPVVASCTMAVLASTLRGPRPRRRLARHPGLLAGFALIPTLAFCASLASFAFLYKGSCDISILLIFLPAAQGTTVLALWTTLLLGRRWRPESSWADRLGRAFGAYWIVAALLMMGSLVVWI